MLNLLKKLRGGAMVGIGYMLSPLSWWNDLFFNLPIALVFGYAASWINSNWFVPGTIVGYWLSNVLGILMMQFGAMDMLVNDEKRNLKRDLLIGIVVQCFIRWSLQPLPIFMCWKCHIS